jgi:hypothetical protein
LTIAAIQEQQKEIESLSPNASPFHKCQPWPFDHFLCAN